YSVWPSVSPSSLHPSAFFLFCSRVFLVFFPFFLFSCPGDLRVLHSFPTRRSSDLMARARFVIAQIDLADRRGRIAGDGKDGDRSDRKSTRLNSSHGSISYAVFCLKKKKNKSPATRTGRTRQNMHANR